MTVDYDETACDLGVTNWPDDRKIILTMLTEDGPALYHETNLRLSYRTYISDDCPSFFDTYPGEDEEAE